MRWVRHTLVPPGAHPAAGRGRRGKVASRERHGDVLRSRRSRCAGCGTRLCRVAHIPPLAVAGRGVVASRERHVDVLGSRRSRCSWKLHTHVPPGAHPAAASRGRGGGCLSRASSTGRAWLAAIAMRLTQHTLVPPSAHPAAGRGWRGKFTSRERHGDVLARCDRDALDAAHACAVWRTSCRRPWPAGESRVARAARRRARIAAIAPAAMRRVRHTLVPPGANPAAGRGRWGVAALSHEQHWDVLGSLRLCPIQAIGSHLLMWHDAGCCHSTMPGRPCLRSG